MFRKFQPQTLLHVADGATGQVNALTLSVLFLLHLLSASHTGELLFSLESVVYHGPHSGNTQNTVTDSDTHCYSLTPARSNSVL